MLGIDVFYSFVLCSLVYVVAICSLIAGLQYSML